jgi:hypothetical protein
VQGAVNQPLHEKRLTTPPTIIGREIRNACSADDDPAEVRDYNRRMHGDFAGFVRMGPSIDRPKLNGRTAGMAVLA